MQTPQPTPEATAWWSARWTDRYGVPRTRRFESSTVEAVARTDLQMQLLEAGEQVPNELSVLPIVQGKRNR